MSNSATRHRQSVAWLVEHTPGAELVEIAGAAHGAHLTHPDAFAALVRQALARSGPSAGPHHDMNILVTGSSGLIGTALVEHLVANDHRVTRLVRGSGGPDGRSAAAAAGGVGPGRTDHRCRGPAAGRPLRRGGQPGRGRHRRPTLVPGPQAARPRQPHSATSLLVDSLLHCPRHRRVLVSASAVGFYGDRGDEELTEASTSGTGFLASVCRAWEAAARPAADAGIRTVLLRTGIVLSRTAGPWASSSRCSGWGSGGRVGSGTQYRSWITLDDEVGVIVHCLGDNGSTGPVNATAPAPATDASWPRPSGPPSTGRGPGRAGPALRLLLGTEMADELLLGGQRVLPAVLSTRGFVFAHTDLDEAVSAVLGSPG